MDSSSLLVSGNGFIREYCVQLTEMTTDPPTSTLEESKVEENAAPRLIVHRRGSMRLEQPASLASEQPLRAQGKRPPYRKIRKVSGIQIQNAIDGSDNKMVMGDGGESSLIEMRAFNTKHCAVFAEARLLLSFSELKVNTWLDLFLESI